MTGNIQDRGGERVKLKYILTAILITRHCAEQVRKIISEQAGDRADYINQYQGCTIANEKDFQYAFYRFHIPDPVYFYNDIKVTIQQIGFAGIEAIENT